MTGTSGGSGPSPTRRRVNRRKTNLSSLERKQIVSALLHVSKLNGDKRVVSIKFVKEIAEKYSVARTTIQRIWKRAKNNFENSVEKTYSASPLTKNNGRHIIYDRREMARAVSELPSHKRRTQRALASELGVSLFTVNRMIKLDHVIKAPTI